MSRNRKKANPEARMRLGEHLIELRKRFIVCLIAVAVAIIGGWFLADYVWEILRAPINEISHEDNRIAHIAFTDVTGSFGLKLKIAFVIAIFIASPIWLYQIWAFFIPALKKREKIAAAVFLGASVPLFLSGAVVAWWALPKIVRILTSFSSKQDALLLTAGDYLNFATTLTISVGIGFVLPVFIVLLNFVDVLSAKSVISKWRIAVLIILVFAASVTPSVEVFSMFLIATPMILLYAVAAILAYFHDRRKARQQRKTFAEYDV
ncbi:twin-arginine translocase subunit TatC [Canibacter zhuwentaonis]|uniref:twin-arginine translocase subunit TatC n=1 Tax=Canibacter zhuwentaonis TaxID=2837491 RepID=UPI003510AE98